MNLLVKIMLITKLLIVKYHASFILKNLIQNIQKNGFFIASKMLLPRSVFLMHILIGKYLSKITYYWFYITI